MIPVELFSVVLPFTDSLTLQRMWGMPTTRPFVVREALRLAVAPLSPLERLSSYHNYGMHDRHNSVHYCLHTRRGAFVFDHQRKNADWDVMVVTLGLCGLCYSWGMWAFYCVRGHAPTLRSHGSMFRRLVLHFERDVDAQERWANDPRSWELLGLLPRHYKCRFYVESSYQQTTELLSAYPRDHGVLLEQSDDDD